jgi:tRNA-dihydrouridine synthase 1
MFVSCARYRNEVMRDLGDASDRPLVVQFCGDDKRALLEAAEACAPHCDGVDLNLGCPQGIARRGHYGAFLLEEPDLVCGIVAHLAARLPVPVTVKIRLLSARDAAPTIALARRLVAAGASALTLHGRTKEMRGQAVGAADWDMIRAVFDALDRTVPLVANGGMETAADMAACLAATGADGAMASEGALEDPTIFGGAAAAGGAAATPLDLADEYLEICRAKAPALDNAKSHLHKLLFELVQAPGREPVRRRLVAARAWDDFAAVLADLRADAPANFARDPDRSWYRRHRRAEREAAEREAERQRREAAEPADDDAAAGLAGLYGDADY